MELEDVGKSWPGHIALDRVSLYVEPGELLTVLGPSGSGKSTALRVIAGLEQLDSGRVLIAGEDVTAVPPARRGVAMVFQSFALFPHLSVAENIGFGLRARGAKPPEVATRVHETSSLLGIEDLLARRPAALSGGERQRVALARGLAGHPRVLLLDEPLSNLDAQLRASARAELRRLHSRRPVTTVHVTHDQGEALTLGDRVAVLHSGRLLQVASPDELYERPVSVEVAAFVGSPPMNLLPATVQDGLLRAAGITTAVPPGVELARGEDVTLGVRPEHVTVARDPSGGGLVELVERSGPDRVLHLSVGSAVVLARCDRSDLAEGERVAISLEPEGIRLFDAHTGAAL